MPPPSNFLLWVAVIGIGINFLAFLWGLYQKRIDREQSIADMFWYRTMILPICWSPLAELINKYVERLHEIDSNRPLPTILQALRGLASEFGAEKNRVLGRFLLLTVFKDEIYESIGDTLDRLEDEIVQHCGPDEPDFDSASAAIAFVESLFWANLTEACKEMMKLHPHRQVPF